MISALIHTKDHVYRTKWVPLKQAKEWLHALKQKGVYLFDRTAAAPEILLVSRCKERLPKLLRRYEPVGIRLFQFQVSEDLTLQDFRKMGADALTEAASLLPGGLRFFLSGETFRYRLLAHSSSLQCIYYALSESQFKALGYTRDSGPFFSTNIRLPDDLLGKQEGADHYNAELAKLGIGLEVSLAKDGQFAVSPKGQSGWHGAFNYNRGDDLVVFRRSTPAESVGLFFEITREHSPKEKVSAVVYAPNVEYKRFNPAAATQVDSLREAEKNALLFLDKHGAFNRKYEFNCKWFLPDSDSIELLPKAHKVTESYRDVGVSLLAARAGDGSEMWVDIAYNSKKDAYMLIVSAENEEALAWVREKLRMDVNPVFTEAQARAIKKVKGKMMPKDRK